MIGHTNNINMVEDIHVTTLFHEYKFITILTVHTMQTLEIGTGISKTTSIKFIDSI